MSETHYPPLLRCRQTSSRAAFVTVVRLVLPLCTVACAQTDPYSRPGVWVPTGVNEANLRAMVAVPSDLVAGHGDNRGNAEIAAMALDRSHRDAVRPLPDSTLSKVGSPPAGSSGNSGGIGGGGGASAGSAAAEGGGN